MLSSLFQSTTIPLLEQVASFAQARHGVLAGNLANLDTPGYQARDLSPALFQERLKRAIEMRRQPPRPYETQWRDHGGLTTARNNDQSFGSILRHDEGNVELEYQINEIVKNQQQHNLAINIMSAQFRLLKAAITERVA
jgi:flagellar basal-body rod protein FlgB